MVFTTRNHASIQFVLLGFTFGFYPTVNGHKKMTETMIDRPGLFCVPMLSTLYSNYSLHLNHLNLIRGVGRINFIVGVTFFPQKNQYDDLRPYFDTVIEGQISTQKNS